MAEEPILFSGEMVRAILDGRKTQTRRVIPHAGGGYFGYIPERNTHWFGLDLRTVGNGPETSIEVKCPYRPGDLLWVRETFMEHRASRITLRVTDVRVERVQDISEADAKAEGVSPAPFTKAGRPMEDAHIDSFELLWNEINGPRGFGWDANPWVWVIEFEMVR